MSPNEIPYLKGIGIRIHTVRYQKLRKLALDVELDGENDDENDVSAKERRRILGKQQRANCAHFCLLSASILRYYYVFPNCQLPRKGG